MIKVTGLNRKEFIINAEHIEIIEEIPESVITLLGGSKYVVLEPGEEIIKRVIEYKNRILIARV